MYYDSTEAISFPTVTVANGVAEWDSNNGEYGGGSAFVGDEGSELPMPGSVDSFELNTKYIPIEDWAVSDYGCYHFTVETTQTSPWSDGSVVSDEVGSCSVAHPRTNRDKTTKKQRVLMTSSIIKSGR